MSNDNQLKTLLDLDWKDSGDGEQVANDGDLTWTVRSAGEPVTPPHFATVARLRPEGGSHWYLEGEYATSIEGALRELLDAINQLRDAVK